MQLDLKYVGWVCVCKWTSLRREGIANVGTVCFAKGGTEHAFMRQQRTRQSLVRLCAMCAIGLDLGRSTEQQLS